MDRRDHHNTLNNINNIIYDNYSQMAATSDNNNIVQTTYTTDNDYEQQPSFSFVNNRHAAHPTSIFQPQPTINSNYASEVSINNNVQNISTPLNFPQPNYPDYPDSYRFVIPGFEIIIIPTSSFANLSMQDQFQQDTNTVVTGESQPQFQQFQQQQNSLDLTDSFNFNNINNFQH
jgi:hypothetical protein